MADTEKESRKTAEEAVAESACSLPKDLENDLRAIGRVSNKSHCQINEIAVVEYINRQKMKQDCREGILKELDCKCVDY